VLTCFGAQRVLWGSDWPVLELAAPYSHWWQITQQCLAGLPAQDRVQILGGNARRIYRL
jgi:L-fuconolactonase